MLGLIVAAGLAVSVPQQAPAAADPLMRGDANHDGVLTHDEVIASALADGGDKASAERVFTWGDRNGDGTLDAEERAQLYAQHAQARQPRPEPPRLRDKLVPTPGREE